MATKNAKATQTSKTPLVKKTRLDMFPGDSHQLVVFLLEKNKLFSDYLQEHRGQLTDAKRDKIKGFIAQIDSITLLDEFFNINVTMSMDELIEKAKAEYELAKLATARKDGVFENAKKQRDAVFADANGYIANKYEASYMSDVQVAYRKACAKYKAAYNALVKAKTYQNTLHGLLGIIHQPEMYFKNVLK